MSRILICSALAIFAALAWSDAARAELCSKCRDLMFMESAGKCTSCSAPLSSDALRLCPKCSAQQHKCERCQAAVDGAAASKSPTTDLVPPPDRPASPLPAPPDAVAPEKPAEGLVPPALLPPGTPADPAPTETSPATPVPIETLPEAQRPAKVQPIDPKKPGSYSVGKWQYRLDITLPGSRSEGKSGWLSYDGQKLPRGEINDYYLTPWGPIYWVDVPKTVWGPHGWMPFPLPQSNRKGRVLNTTAASQAAPAAATAPPATWFEIGRTENGKRARVVAGRYVLIRLPGNPTTGYQWQAMPASSAAVRLLSQPQYVAAPESAGKVGGGGTYLFKYQAVQAGTAVIRLNYARPWERGKPPVETFTVTLDVLPAAGAVPTPRPARSPAPKSSASRGGGIW